MQNLRLRILSNFCEFMGRIFLQGKIFVEELMQDFLQIFDLKFMDKIFF